MPTFTRNGLGIRPKAKRLNLVLALVRKSERMHVQRPKLPTELLLLFLGNPLLPEKHHPALGNQQREILDLLVRKLVQLNPRTLGKLGPDSRGQIEPVELSKRALERVGFGTRKLRERLVVHSVFGAFGKLA